MPFIRIQSPPQLEWMDVANIIINTKKKEFMSIIELYRENHDRGFQEIDLDSFAGSKEFLKKKKKTRKGKLFLSFEDCCFSFEFFSGFGRC